MNERGVVVDQALVHRWAIKILPVLAAVFRRHNHDVGLSWREDKTYSKALGEWKYLYRTADCNGDTIGFRTDRRLRGWRRAGAATTGAPEAQYHPAAARTRQPTVGRAQPGLRRGCVSGWQCRCNG